jgi:hypothetical protein
MQRRRPRAICRTVPGSLGPPCPARRILVMMEDMLPPDHSLPMHRALLALEGLSLGDAFGECFFDSSVVLAALGATRALPTAPWNYTDDTV